MRDRPRKRPSPALVIAVIALFAALGGGYAIGASKIDTEDIRKQAVTNKKVKKATLKNNRVKDDTLTGQKINEGTLGTVPTADVAGTGRSAANDGPILVPGSSGFTTAVSLNVPAGSYLLIAKTNLAKGPATLLACRTVAEGDSDTATTHVASDQNVTVSSTVAHTFAAAGTATLECNNPTPGSLVLTQAKLSAIPFAALESTPAG